MKILAIETSGKTASVAITEDETLLWEKNVVTKLTHSQVILPMVKQSLEDTSLDFSDFDCVAVANGPGSYTGLRIGIGAVKGICMGQPGLKCAGVSTLLGLAYNCIEFNGKIISVMKARPGIVYAGEFVSDSHKIMRIGKDRICKEEEVFGDENFGQTILIGDYAREIKEKYFGNNINVTVASPGHILQKASGIAFAVYNNPEMMTDQENLTVSYLQATKAEKDKAHRDN